MIGDEMRLAADPSAASLTIGDGTEMLGHQQAPRNRYEGTPLTRLRKNIVARENFNSLHVWPNRRTLPQDAQKAVLFVCGSSGLFRSTKKQNKQDKPNNGLRLNPIGFPCNQNRFSRDDACQVLRLRIFL